MPLLLASFKEEGMTDILSEEGFRVQRRLEWGRQARAAGWSAPVPSRLRAVEKCERCRLISKIVVEQVHPECPHCHGTGTISRPLTQAETNEVAEALMMVKDYQVAVREITLKSGLKVMLLEETNV
jgi:hypothetical protein